MSSPPYNLPARAAGSIAAPRRQQSLSCTPPHHVRAQLRMAVTACAYGYDGGRRPPSPALQAMGPFDGDDDDRGRHRPIFHDQCCIIHGVVMPPPPAPPPPPPPPPLFHASSKAAASRHPGLCTEGLGSESSESSGDLDLAGVVGDDDIEDCKSQQQGHCDDQGEPAARTRGNSKRVFPPPISVIGAAGKPWQYLRAQRGGGRLVLREVRIPSRELLHACREDGRLKLHFAHPEPEEHHHLADDDDDKEECNNQQYNSQKRRTNRPGI